MSDIPTELFLEILRRVPVESLFTFRSVCKTWRRIIDEPNFSKLHFRRGLGRNWFFHRHKKGKLFVTDMVFKKLPYIEYFRAPALKTLVGLGVPRLRQFPVPSCNGLILLSTCKTNMVWRIWNPFTGESLELGLCDEFTKFDARYLDHTYSGIGYDDVSDDYKVVRIDEPRAFVYSLNSKEWRGIEDFPDTPFGDGGGVFAHGALHWFARPRERNNVLGFIVSLDLSTEKYRRIPLPVEIYNVYRSQLSLKALSDCLFVSCSDLGGQFVAWTSKDYGSENMTWVKMISLEDTNRIRPMAYLKNKQRVLLHCKRDSYLWYDLVKNSSEILSIRIDEKVDDFEEEYLQYIYDSFSSQVFPASLVRLKRNDEADEGVVPRATLKRKRKSFIASERTCMLPMKLVFGDPEEWPYNWMDTWPNHNTINNGSESD